MNPHQWRTELLKFCRLKNVQVQNKLVCVSGRGVAARLCTGMFVGMLALPLMFAYVVQIGTVSADLRNVPTWFDPDGVANGNDWHYRVPITLPTGAAVASTIKMDVNFAQLLADLGVDPAAVDFDENSVRIVRPGGALAAEQEFTDELFGGLLDVTNNARGEIKFIAEDTAGAGAYYLYFDVTANGVKPLNPQQVVNGNFEQSAGTVATRWATAGQNTGGGERNLVQSTVFGATASVTAACSSNAANNFENGPNNNGATATGTDWYLLGYRENCEDGGGGIELVQLQRTIQNPTGAARGNLTFYFQVQSFDGLQTTGDNYDYFRLLVNGALIDHTTLAINNAAAPALRIRNLGIGRAGFNNALVTHGWKLATLNMTQFPTGATTLSFETRLSAADDNYRTWTRLDDIEWAVQTGTLGAVEAFGVNVTLPNDTAVGTQSVYSVGQSLSIIAQVDAQAAAVTAQITDQNGTIVNAAVTLFDDGTHGDATAGDGQWTNDGSDAAFATYTFGAGDPQGNNWQVAVQALDSSTSNLGVSNGLLHINGQPIAGLTQPNYWNIDQQVFTYAAPDLSLMKLSFVLSDPFNGTVNPKRIPGALIEYRLSAENAGAGAVDNNETVLTDPLPADTALCVSALCSGNSDSVIFDDSASPVVTGLTYVFASNVTYSTDGIDFSYVPAPDTEGFDDAITHVRINPGGSLAGGGASFIVRLFVRVD